MINIRDLKTILESSINVPVKTIIDCTEISQTQVYRYLDYAEKERLIYSYLGRPDYNEKFRKYYYITEKGGKVLKILKEYERLMPMEFR